MKTLRAILLPALALSLLTACGKNDDDGGNAVPACRIATLTSPNFTGTITYNAERKISQCTITAGTSSLVRDFLYTGANTIIIITKENGVTQGRDSITVNGAGYATNARSYNAAGTTWQNTAYTYNCSNEKQSSSYTSSTNSTPQVNTHTYTNGNLTSSTNSSGTDYYAYDETRPAQPGDYFSFIEFVTGYKTTKTKNLVSQYTYSTSPATPTLLAYEFTDGRISKLTQINGSSTGSLTFTYNCD